MLKMNKIEGKSPYLDFIYHTLHLSFILFLI